MNEITGEIKGAICPNCGNDKWVFLCQVSHYECTTCGEHVSVEYMRLHEIKELSLNGKRT